MGWVFGKDWGHKEYFVGETCENFASNSDKIWQDNIKVGLRELACEDGRWIVSNGGL
jgi:hypothetical protein